MARKWLFVGCQLFLASGCIVADPPQYEDPARTPPILDLARATPFIGGITVVERRNGVLDDIDFNVPFRSNDQGERVFTSMHVDFTFDTADMVVPSLPFPASDINDKNRSIQMTVSFARLGGIVGCHQLTLLAAHEDNWNFNSSMPILPQAQDDTAMATWWINVDPEPGSDPFTLQNCPNRNEVQK